MRKIKRLCVGVVFGGKSTEHEISLRSAKNIINAIDKNRFEVVLLHIDKDGKWYINDIENHSINIDDPTHITFCFPKKSIAFLFGQKKAKLVNPKNFRILKQIDVVFPIVHGLFGEDGSLQGMLRMANLPFVGSDILSSAVCMDKDITKRLLRDAGLKIAPFVTLTRINRGKYNFFDLKNLLDLPFFVKPANQGSSIGITRVNNKEQFSDAVNLAFKFSNKVVVESEVQGREIECALLGSTSPQASTCGEVLVDSGFYSYDKKYIDSNSVKIIIPASLDLEIQNKIREVAVAAYQILDCHGMARVDIFLTPKNKIVINEINTLPGFSDTSMYPKLWKATGLDFSELISRLIDIALERHTSLHSIQI